MPKNLYLPRHAESVEKLLRTSDKDRELTPKGIHESVLIGNYLLQTGVNFDGIISSSATRTQLTTQIVSETLKFSADRITYEDDLYDASLRTFLDFVRRVDENYNTVLFVGHNPTVSYLAEFLSKAELSDMATASVAVLKLKVNSWREVDEGKAELSTYMAPDMLQN